MSSGSKRGAISRRSLLRGAAALGAAAAAPAVHAARGGDPIRRENDRAGTRDWLLRSTRIDPATRYRSPGIEGYCSRTSLRAGERLQIFVSTNPPSRFTIDLYRMGCYGGDGGRAVRALGSFAGTVRPDPEIGPRRLRECRWKPAVELEIPRDWLSGVYLGKLTAERDGLQSYVIFIVRDDRRADFLFQCSDTTWQAYNRWPSQFSLYDDGRKQWYWGPGVDVSFARPYGKYCQIVDAPLSTGSGEWFLWEFPIAHWMESRGYDLTYISNLDTHADARGLERARALLSAGHDEYYSIEMFRNVQRAIDGGVHVAFLSGNTCCGRIDFGGGSGRTPPTRFTRTDVFGPADPADIARFPDMGLLPHRSPNANTLVGARSVAPIVRPSVYTTPRGPDPRIERITANLLERMRGAR